MDEQKVQTKRCDFWYNFFVSEIFFRKYLPEGLVNGMKLRIFPGNFVLNT